MDTITELRILFSVALILWLIVSFTTIPFYIIAMRRIGSRFGVKIPFVVGLTVMGIANLFETTFFFYVVWFNLSEGWSHLALLSIPGSLIVRAFAHGLTAWAVLLRDWTSFGDFWAEVLAEFRRQR